MQHRDPECNKQIKRNKPRLEVTHLTAALLEHIFVPFLGTMISTNRKKNKRNKQKKTGNDKHMQQLAPFSERSRRRRPVPPGFPKLQRSESPFGRQSIHNLSVQSTTMLFVSNHSSALDPRSIPSIQVLVQHIIAVPYKKRR